MAGDVVIRAEGLGKRYLIGHQAPSERYVALRDVIARNVRNVGRSAMDLVRGRPNVTGDRVEEFWALKGVEFDIRRGEVVGVIGRNGAGKSTLLKVLSRITEPSEGRVEIRGRVASLLEVGTGFHPELTGRENIFLNGAILGMTHAEIRRKFDEIVDFAEVERFLDTPVKRYSSGMYVRLAFAVAAHLEPEILIVDEVLAVGDAEFQKKCLGKMGEVAGHGRTVLFVSHNMAAVQALCGRGILMGGGATLYDGPIAQTIATYVQAPVHRGIGRDARRIQSSLSLTRIRLSEPALECGSPLRVAFDFEASMRGAIYECTVLICNMRGDRIAVIDPRETGRLPFTFEAGTFTLNAEIDGLPLVAGDYTLGLAIQADEAWDDYLELAEFSVFPRAGMDFTPIAPEWRGALELSARAHFEASPCGS